jgi:hypothetical protein
LDDRLARRSHGSAGRASGGVRLTIVEEEIMKRFTVTLVALVLMGAPLIGQAPSRPSAARQDEDGASRTTHPVFPAFLAGRWTSAPFELALTSDFHRSVYGNGARSVRTVTMVIRPTGEGVFTVTNTVRDGRGRQVAGTRQIEELRFTVGELVEEPGRQPRYATRIEHAERRFTDDPASAFPLDGAQLALYAAASTPTIEARFDTPEGTGSFWETLRRTRSGPVAAR